MVQLDKEPYQIQVDLKKAAVVNAEADLEAAQTQVRGILAQAGSLRWKLQTSIEDVDDKVALLRARVAALGRQIAQDYADAAAAGSPPILIGVLNGAFVFAADLVRSIAAPMEIDFLGVRSYGDATETSGVVQITSDRISAHGTTRCALRVSCDIDDTVSKPT